MSEWRNHLEGPDATCVVCLKPIRAGAAIRLDRDFNPAHAECAAAWFTEEYPPRRSAWSTFES